MGQFQRSVLTRLGAAAAAALAIFSLAYGDFAPGGQSLSTLVPSAQALTYAVALLVFAASVGLLLERATSVCALLLGVYEAVWITIAALPIRSNPWSLGSWYGSCEALTAIVAPWLLYVTMRSTRGSTASTAGTMTMRAAQGLFGFMCVFYGVSHFVYADYTAGMVPAWLPSRLGFAYVTGVGHIAAGVSIILGPLAPLAATLEALMMSLFGMLVWVPSFFAQPRPPWTGSTKNQWSELVINIVLAASAWIVAVSLRKSLPVDSSFAPSE